MTKEEIEAIEAIQGTAGFRVIQSCAESMLEKVKDIMEVKIDGLVAEQTIGRQIVYKELKEFLSELKLTSPSEKGGNKTYE